MPYLSGAYFDVALRGEQVELKGSFTAVSGLGMEAEYEIYNEGGLNYPRFFFAGTKPQTLVLEQGLLTTADAASRLMEMCNQGMAVPLEGTVTLKDSFGAPQRVWNIVGAYLQKYTGPDLNSNQPALAVTRMEFIYNGCY